MTPESRAEYFRERRKTRKQFNVLCDREIVEALEQRLQEQGKTKTTWFKEKVAEELSQDKK